jgi:hypothetical protein
LLNNNKKVNSLLRQMQQFWAQLSAQADPLKKLLIKKAALVIS